MAAEQKWRGKIGGLSPEEMSEFLSGKPFCRLGCLDDEGWPYVVPCWFEYGPEGYYIIPRARSAWAQYISNNRRVFLCIDDDTIYNRRVLVKGEASVVEKPNLGGKWVEIARRMSVRYLGERGPDYLEPTPGRSRASSCWSSPETTTWQGVAWAKRYQTQSRSGNGQ
jgi:nitroimidazol reductase NimA-like FMN-containing flavoprotein (pyridoxamine 5'-phosphate oxidase superfamily)